MRNIGERIALARKRAGLTQAELGEKVGFSRAQIGNWESGFRKAKPEMLGALAPELHVDTAWLACLASQIYYLGAMCEIVSTYSLPDGKTQVLLDHPDLGLIEAKILIDTKQ